LLNTIPTEEEEEKRSWEDQ